MWWGKKQSRQETVRPMPIGPGLGADSGVNLRRRTLVGAVASVFALANTPGLSALGPQEEEPGAVIDAEHYVLVDGWVIPGKFFRN